MKLVIDIDPDFWEETARYIREDIDPSFEWTEDLKVLAIEKLEISFGDNLLDDAKYHVELFDDLI